MRDLKETKKKEGDFIQIRELVGSFPENCIGKKLFYEKCEVGYIYLYDGVRYYVAVLKPNYVNMVSNMLHTRGLKNFFVSYQIHKNSADSLSRLSFL